jgi:hypothetical protein
LQSSLYDALIFVISPFNVAISINLVKTWKADLLLHG